MTLGYIGGTVSRLRPLVDTYRAAGERAGHQDALKVAISTHFYAGADPAQARAVYPYYHEYLRPKGLAAGGSSSTARCSKPAQATTARS
jgi:alkanesulfonate monooxygenase SsuD/methylene tetrahydromethanopterin reductase-like flavin-dependent oxidoreductase (luciferase family)